MLPTADLVLSKDERESVDWVFKVNFLRDGELSGRTEKEGSLINAAALFVFNFLELPNYFLVFWGISRILGNIEVLLLLPLFEERDFLLEVFTNNWA